MKRRRKPRLDLQRTKIRELNDLSQVRGGKMWGCKPQHANSWSSFDGAGESLI